MSVVSVREEMLAEKMVVSWEGFCGKTIRQVAAYLVSVWVVFEDGTFAVIRPWDKNGTIRPRLVQRVEACDLVLAHLAETGVLPPGELRQLEMERLVMQRMKAGEKDALDNR